MSSQFLIMYDLLRNPLSKILTMPLVDM